MELTDANATVTVHVPLAFRQRRGRKVLVGPDGAGRDTLGSPRSPERNPLEVTPAMRALARAFRWRKLLETGAMATVHEIAKSENINPSYVSRILRLTLIAPEIVEVFLAGKRSDHVTLERLMLPFATDWEKQPLGIWL